VAKKKTALTSSLFRDIDPYAQTQTESDDNLAPLPLTVIRPDPDQPRRILTANLIRMVAAGTRSPNEALQQWMNEGGKSSAQKLRELQKLARSIEMHGLINAITIRPPRAGEQAPAGVKYFIVTGERRYWAHVLLNLEGRPIQAGTETVDPAYIRTIISAEGITIRAHQLIENIIREDINAIEKAHGLWALRYELSGVNYSSPEMAAGGKVNYSSPSSSLVPWAQVEETLDISKRYRIYLTNVLNLSEEAQTLVMEHDLAEMTIRPITQKLKKNPDLQIAALRQLIAWQQEDAADNGGSRAITKSVQELVEHLLRRAEMESGSRKTDVIELSSEAERFRSKVRGTARFLNRMKAKDVTTLARDLALDANHSDTVETLHNLRQQIDDLLRQVAEYQTPE
jgi:hypothetical protein